jgi:hypothetical protein
MNFHARNVSATSYTISISYQFDLPGDIPVLEGP